MLVLDDLLQRCDRSTDPCPLIIIPATHAQHTHTRREKERELISIEATDSPRLASGWAARAVDPAPVRRPRGRLACVTPEVSIYLEVTTLDIKLH